MTEQFSVTSVGYSHVKEGKPCQDFSLSYQDTERTVIAACDGHGGELYVRSHKGSRFASLAVLNAMMEIPSLSFRKYRPEDIEHSLKLNILCEWNRLLEKDLAEHPLRKSEVAHLKDEQIKTLRQAPAKAYGSTLCGAMLLGNRLICVGIGDGGAFLLKNGALISAFGADEDEPVANVTHSLCGEDAFEHMHAKVFDARRVDGVMLCTDGVTGPYQSIENFRRAFVRPTVRCVLEGNVHAIKRFVRDLGRHSGTGDDVSLAMILKNDVKTKYYR